MCPKGDLIIHINWSEAVISIGRYVCACVFVCSNEWHCTRSVTKSLFLINL